jgi:hypothetical protein
MSAPKEGLDPRLLIAGDFIMLRMALVDALDGDIEAALVLQRIAWRCERDGEWKASHEDIQQETRLSERKVKTALKVLRDRGFLASRRSSAYDATMVWSVRLDTDETSVSESDETSVSPSSKTGETDPMTAFTLLPQDIVKAQRVTKAKAIRGYAFDEWWAIVPKKVAKGAAERAYRTALTKTTHDVLMKATRDLIGWNALGPRQYIPNPATWLNGERWNDEVVPESKAQKPRDLSAAWIKQDFSDPFAGLA